MRIQEDKYYQGGPTKTYSELNTDEQRRRGEFYLDRYNALKAEMQDREEMWDKIEKQYKCDRDYISDAPNSFVPVLAPIINGQIASIVDQNLSVKVKGITPSDQHFAASGQKIAEFILKKNSIKLKCKSIVGRYLKQGVGWVVIDWDANALDGFGMPVIRSQQTTKIFVDGNIKDTLDYQKAQYIIEEVGYQSIMWARQEFGDDIADFLTTNTTMADFDAETTDDEQFSFMYLKVWHRNNKHGNLQLLEMDDTGFVLRDSDKKSPYYEGQYNNYPMYPIGLYQEEGVFHRFGDGQLLYFIQDTINKLYDEIITACKFTSQSRTFIDPDGEMDPDDFDNDPSHPVLCRMPHQNVYVASPGVLNPVIEKLVANLMNEARRITRFSDLMTGNSPSGNITATEAGIQNNQGNTGISDKKGDISEGLKFAINYAINMCIELWESGQWFRITEDKDDFEWLDTTQLKKVPVLIPSDQEFRSLWREKHPESDISLMPQYTQYVPDKDIVNDNNMLIAKKGEAQTKRAAFDLDVSIGEGLPSSPIALYNIMLSLAQISLIDENTGQPRPLIGYEQFRKMMEETIGIPFDEAMEEAKRISTQNGVMTPDTSNQAPLNVSSNIPGANINGQMIGPKPTGA